LRNSLDLILLNSQEYNNLSVGGIMPVRFNVIAGQKLLKRWHMSQAELLFVRWNQKLMTVHRERGAEGWIEDPDDDCVITRP
jgi:hypothetical protein